MNDIGKEELKGLLEMGSVPAVSDTHLENKPGASG